MIYDKYSYSVPDNFRLRVITNTDAKNEADDQYAIVHTLLSPRFDNVGVIAAHFGERRTKNSMKESYDEVALLLDLMGFDKSFLVSGAPHAIPDEDTPVPSDGARMIIEEAMKESDSPLFVTFLGPLTDMASAYLMEPRIADRLTCIWIGGGIYPEGGQEFNLSNDIAAANVVFNSGIPLWQVPKDVYQQMLVSITELEHRVRPCGKLGEYLFSQLAEHARLHSRPPVRTGETWILGDSPVVGLMLWEHPNDYDIVPAPNVDEKMRYIHIKGNRPIRVYRKIDPRFILEDFYAKLALFTKE